MWSHNLLFKWILLVFFSSSVSSNKIYELWTSLPPRLGSSKRTWYWSSINWYNFFFQFFQIRYVEQLRIIIIQLNPFTLFFIFPISSNKICSAINFLISTKIGFTWVAIEEDLSCFDMTQNNNDIFECLYILSQLIIQKKATILSTHSVG